MNVGIINYGMGNIGSVVRALSLLGVQPLVMDSPKDFDRVQKVILPGVGAFSAAMRNLRESGWVEAFAVHVRQGGMPLLGICLGMQLLADEGEENGPSEGLGLIPGRVVPIPASETTRVPHVGWNEVVSTGGSTLLDGIPAGTDFYFVHSYVFATAETSHVAATSNYGGQFAAAVSRDNVSGTQFHPEKSSRAGAKLLQNFLGNVAC